LKLLLPFLFGLIFLTRNILCQNYKPYDPYEPYLSYEEQLKHQKEFLKKLNAFIKNKTQRQTPDTLSKLSPPDSLYPLDNFKLNKFLDAIALQESKGYYHARNPISGANGKYQFIASTWNYWTRRYAKTYNLPLSQVLPQTPLNQERVSRFKAETLFRRYGNWRDVACYWYSGYSWKYVLQKGWADKSQTGGPTIRQYVQGILNKMKNKT
jgi:hypothetical protein